MPCKDPEKYKKYMAEQMRQRRAQAKAAATGDNLPPVANAPAPASQSNQKNILKKGPENLRGESQGSVTTRSEPSPRSQLENDPARRIGIIGETPVGGFWSRFPGQEGRPCFNDARYSCCYDLNFPVPWARYYCPCPPRTCNYSKAISLFDMAEAK